MPERIVVVGAGLAGASAAAELRKRGFTGELHLIGAEPHPPYTRPPLSKKALTDGPRDLTLPVARKLDARLHLGLSAAAVDLDEGSVRLDSGEPLSFDGLVVATGSAPVLLDRERFEGVLYLRTVEDGDRVRAAVRRPADRPLVILGAGLIGCEVASSARAAGHEVIMVDLVDPCTRAVGAFAAGYLRRLHERQGVGVVVGVTAESVRRAEGVSTVLLSDGSVLEAADVLVSVGSRPATGWLEGSGLRVADGVVCDAACVAGPGVVAAGDVARWQPAGSDRLVRLENWNNAAEQGRHAARSLLAQLAGTGAVPYAPVPWYWTEQHGVRLQVAGWLDPTVVPTVLEGALDEDSFLLEDPGRQFIVAANRPRQFNDWLGRAMEKEAARA
ncbi:NAD(P)/FAD-dependent oxidoreductase [Nocardioides humi]|uniref:FAD-dependent oxidoreductase n=1 Tax=Nocardioides humi TaxID=449461 RepID=A0ABN2B3C9_9ACTN|nr:FAD-dependent oxidoreductase [Nocardioides humi]